MLRQLAVKLMPHGHPVQQFEQDLISTLKGAERGWFGSSVPAECGSRIERDRHPHIRFMVIGAAAFMLFGIILNLIIGEGVSDIFVHSAGI